LKQAGFDGSKDITPEDLSKLKERENLMWEAEKVAGNIDEPISVDDFLEKVGEYKQDHIDVRDELELMYGDDKVFFEDMGRGNERVYVVQDDGHTEVFGQPSDYDDAGIDDPSAFDRDPKVASETMDSTQMGVLNGYYDLMKRWVPKYEKATGAKVKIIEEDGHTWLEITDPKIPPKTAF
jgi:hypothetical protein